MTTIATFQSQTNPETVERQAFDRLPSDQQAQIVYSVAQLKSYVRNLGNQGGLELLMKLGLLLEKKKVRSLEEPNIVTDNPRYQEE